VSPRRPFEEDIDGSNAPTEALERLGWSAGRVRPAYAVLSILSAAFPGLLILVLWIAMPGPED
jgi:hypothetical protein